MPYLKGYTSDFPVPTLYAGVPDHKDIVERVNREYPHLLQYNTASACCEFLQKLVKALPANERWGLLSKSEGEGGFTWPNGVRTSYDYVTVPQGDRIDVIASAAGHNLGIPGGPAWVPAKEHEWRPSNTYVDISGWPTYTSDAPTEGTQKVCSVGFGWFCMMTAIAEWESEFRQNWEWIMSEINPDCFRVMLCVEGQMHGSPDCWRDAGVFINEDWENRYKKMLDIVGEAGKTVHATIYGGRYQTQTSSERHHFHDRIINASAGRWSAIRSFECMNEFRVNGWYPEEVRDAGRDMRSKLPGGFRLSLSSPSAAHGESGPNCTNEEMLRSFEELYGGDDHAGANEITIHTMRDGGKWSDPFSFNFCFPSLPKINNEPPGPGSSSGGMHTTGQDVYRDCSKTAQAGWAMYMGHSEWSVWNGHLPVEYHNGWREIPYVWNLPNMPQCAAALKALGEGEPTEPVYPEGPGGGEEMIPYDEAKSIEFGTECNKIYEEANIAKDPGMVSVHSQRCAWDYYVLKMAWEPCFKKHVNEFRDVYGLPHV